jgi:hypothetical protein
MAEVHPGALTTGPYRKIIRRRKNPLKRKFLFPYSSAEIINGLKNFCIFKYRL